jgi:glycosyltransferase involved in cell wall biosynthesis
LNGASITSQATSRPVVAVVGPTSPPTNGITVVIERILDSRVLAERFRLIHVDTSDHREIINIGRLDFRNCYLAVVHWWRVVKTLVRYRPDVVHISLAQNYLGLLRDWTLLTAAHCTPGTKVVAHVSGGGFARFLSDSAPVFRHLLIAAVRRSAVLIVSTEWHRQQIQRLFGDARFAVVWKGTEDMADGRRVPSRAAVKALYVSSQFTEDKGFFDVLEAAALTDAEGAPVRWEFVGAFLSTGDEERAIARAAEIDSAEIVGPIERRDVLSAYREADVFVFPPSGKEGFGLVRVEAMAAGLPVITTEAGGGREVVVDGETGFIVEYGQPKEIAERVIELARDPDRRLRMGRKALQRQRRDFSVAAFERSLTAAWRAGASR